MLTFTTFGLSGRQLVSWRMSWHSGSEFDLPFRPAAVRLLVRAEGGQQAEAELGDDDVRLVLRD